MRTLPFLLLSLGLLACGSSSSAPGDASADSASDGGPAEDATSQDALANNDASSDATGDAPAPEDAAATDAPEMDAPEMDAPEMDAAAPTCTADGDCPGACIGRSCDGDWTCQTDVACTDDIVAYCGCDGVTFSGSSTCPPRPYQSRGACPSADGANCDRRSVTCRAPEPRCRDGQVAEVTPDGSCWTFECVAINECGCTMPEECPDADRYTCRRDIGRCTPFL